MRWDAHDGLFDIVLVKSSSRLSRNVEEATVVRYIYELYLKGYSVDMIMNVLAENSIKSPTEKK